MLRMLRCGIVAAALALPVVALAQPSLPGGPPSLPGGPPGAPSGGPPPDPRAKQQRQAPQAAPQQAPGQPSMRAPGGGGGPGLPSAPPQYQAQPRYAPGGGGPGLPSAPPQYQAQPRYVPGPGVPHGAPPPPPRERRYVEPRYRWVAPPAIYLPPWRRYSYIVEDDCAWIGRRAIRTDSEYWWRRYEACRYYGYDIYDDY